MKPWIWIAIVVMACSSGTPSTDTTRQKVETKSFHIDMETGPITIKQIGEHRVMRIPGPNGQATFVLATALSLCPNGKPPCRGLVTCDDCIPPICPCEKEGCSKWCNPRFWPTDLDDKILKDLGIDPRDRSPRDPVINPRPEH